MTQQAGLDSGEKLSRMLKEIAEVKAAKSAWGNLTLPATKKDIIDEMAIEYMARGMVEGLPISMKVYNESTNANWTVRQMNYHKFSKRTNVETPSSEFLDLLRKKIYIKSNGLIIVKTCGTDRSPAAIGFHLFRRNSQQEPFDLEDENNTDSDDDEDEYEEKQKAKRLAARNSLKVFVVYKGKDDSNPTFEYQRGSKIVMF